MRRTLAALGCLLSTTAVATGVAATADAPTLAAPSGLTATVATQSVRLAWDPVAFPRGTSDTAVLVLRDGADIASLPADATSYDDADVVTGQAHTYTVEARATRGHTASTSAPSAPATVRLPGYLVGAATADITPAGVVNLGGFGLGDGSVIPEEVAGRGDQAGPDPGGNRIRARALVVGDGRSTVAIADIETQGMFAAYEAGAYGLDDMAAQVARDIPGLPADHIVIASDHTHHGPDTIGAWGGVSTAYLQLVFDRTVSAIETAYRDRRFADLRAGSSDASDLIYNQGCTEALNQSATPDYPGPDVCPVPGKDGLVRVVQATAPGGTTVATLMVFAAHSTTNMGHAIDGDWPQFLGDAMAAEFGGVGIGMEGANGGTQPCRPTCAFTSPANPGYSAPSRFDGIRLNYLAHVRDALAHAVPVTGPVAAAKGYVREAIVGPFVNLLFAAGDHAGTPLMRSHESPWMVGQTVRTPVSDVRIGDLLFDATPGEGFAAIRSGVAAAVDEGHGSGPSMVIQLGLAGDQLGYLIAPAAYAVPIAAEAAVNDNIIFNVSPTIGDHVMCADIALAPAVGFTATAPATCAPYTVEDAAGDPLAAVPVGGVKLP
jgi:hypothetical protein